jgi:acyl-CoA thioester hydrolase
MARRNRGVQLPFSERVGFAITVRVYYEDTDAGGVVYYANYLRFLERARTDWLRSAGISQQNLAREQNLQFVVRSLKLDFLAPAMLDDELVISVCPRRLARTYMELEQDITCNGRIICRGGLRIACVARATMRPVKIPEPIMSLARLQSVSLDPSQVATGISS